MRTVISGNLGRVTTLLVACAAGCTLVNSFDDVHARPEGTYATGSSPGDPQAAQTPASAEAAAPEASTTADAGAPMKGAIVMTALVEGDGSATSVLTVLDPATGLERGTREPMVATAIQYDGMRDLWYIFESSGADFAATANDTVTLHVRSLDLTTGLWTEQSKTQVPTTHSYDTVAIVRERIGYVAYSDVDGGTSPVGRDFVTLDTSDPTHVAIVNKLPLSRVPLGARGTRSTTGAGGLVNLVQLNTSACVGLMCNVELVPMFLPNPGPTVASPAAQVGSALKFGFPSFAVSSKLERDIIISTRNSSTDASAPSSASLIDVRSPFAPDGPPISFVITDQLLRRAAFSECTQTAFVVGANGDVNVYAVPVLGDGGGTPSKISTGHSGQSVYFEPTTASVLVPFGQGDNFDLSAFKLGGTRETPTLERRVAPGWDPPKELRPILLGVREPVPVACP